MKFYLTGHHAFSNRGCEAIVRSTVMLLNKQYENVVILVPSSNIALDQKQWPEASKYGVLFVKAYLPSYTRYWVNFLRLPFKFLKELDWPFPFPEFFYNDIKSVDAVLSIGGDNYSLDYRLPVMLMGMDQLAVRLGKPVYLWGASVGPFEAEPHFLPTIKKHLANFNAIFVRETVSYKYLTDTLGLSNVVQMADPAFTLAPETVSIEHFWPKQSFLGVVGLNISPLIERYKKNGQDLRAETIQFIKNIVNKGYSVLLLPHVIPLDGAEKGNDASYMAEMLNDLAGLGKAVNIMPSNYNASEIKFVISKLDYFIGARTHATIAALSSRVPTISIAYSVKAKGINQDLLGDLPVVLSTPSLTADTLMQSLNFLVNNREKIITTIEKQLPFFKESLFKAIKII